MAILFFTYNHSNRIRQMKWLFLEETLKTVIRSLKLPL
ncbi:hypothetical protein AUQ45_1560 [Streptococcus pyogenes]|nr:hypothetical protein AUQ45_1560 [Streptococcus pyogenes]